MSDNSVFNVSHELGETGLHRRLRSAILVQPLGKPFQGFGRNVGIVALFAGSVPAFGQLPLIVGAPNCLQVSVDVEVLLVRNAEELQPAAKRLPAAVAVEGVRDALVLQPLVCEGGYVSDVLLSVTALGVEPFAVDPEVVSLHDLQELHSGNWTRSVPVRIVQRVSRGVELKVSRRRAVSSFAEALPIDPPGSCVSLLKVELAPSIDHFSIPIALVGVDTMGS